MREMKVLAAFCAVISAARGQILGGTVTHVDGGAPVENAALWLKADSINARNPEQVVGNKVKIWPDMSGNQRHAKNLLDVNAQPAYLTSTAHNSMTGLPAVSFGEGTPSKLDLEEPLFVPGGHGGIAMFMVITATGKDAGSVFQTGVDKTNGYGITASSTQAGMYTPNSGPFTGAETVESSTAAGCTMLVSGLVYFGSQDGKFKPVQELYINGKLVGDSKTMCNDEGGTLDACLPQFLTALDDVALKQAGPIKSSVGSSFKGQLHELIIYDRSIPNSERLAVEAYLIDKYYVRIEPDIVPICSVPARFSFKATEVYKFYFNGRLMAEASSNVVGVSSERAVNLPRVPHCGDVLAVHSEILPSSTYRGIIGQLIKDVNGNSEVIAVTDSTWACSHEPWRYGDIVDNNKINTEGFVQSTDDDALGWSESGYNSRFSWNRTHFTEGQLNNPANGRGTISPDAAWIWALNNGTHRHQQATNLLNMSHRAYCRMAVGPAIDRVVPNQADWDSGATVTVIGRGFGTDQMSGNWWTASEGPKEPIPDVIIQDVGACQNVQRINERQVTCVLPRYKAASMRRRAVNFIVQQQDYSNRPLEGRELGASSWTSAAKKYLNTPACGTESFVKSYPFTYTVPDDPAAHGDCCGPSSATCKAV